MKREKAIIYVRHSSIEQSQSGNSYAQEALVRNWCEMNDIEVDTVFTEITTARTPLSSRPEYTKALNHIREHHGEISHFVVLKWDRLSTAEDTYNAVTKLMRDGVKLTAIEQPLDLFLPHGRKMLNFLCR